MANNNTPFFLHSRNTTLVNSPLLDSTHSRNPSFASISADSIDSIMSGPFQYAEDLETASDAVLNFYLNSADNDTTDTSQERMAYKPLLRAIKQSDLVQGFKDGVTSVITCIVEVGDLLFPPPYLLNEEVKQRVLELSEYVKQYTSDVVNHLNAKVERSYEAFCRLPNPYVTDGPEELALSIAAWTAITDKLHLPTGRESYIFKQISAIYSTHVYHPFLQLHRTDPDHNMWQLDSQLTSISMLLREAAMLSERADKSVRAIDEEFELTMSSKPGTPAWRSTDTGNEAVGTKSKTNYPRKSAPTVHATTLRSPPRQRENTL